MVYTNLTGSDATKHGLFESSRLIATDIGRIYDVLVVDENKEGIDVDNGVAVKVGDFTGNGLQERTATIAAITDRIAVIGTPANVKDAFTKAQEQATNFYNKADVDAKAYAVYAEHEDIFAVAAYQFTEASASAIAKDAYVVVDGKGMWVAQAAAPSETAYGFIGKIHSLSYDSLDNVTMVRIEAIQNKQLATSGD